MYFAYCWRVNQEQITVTIFSYSQTMPWQQDNVCGYSDDSSNYFLEKLKKKKKKYFAITCTINSIAFLKKPGQ